MFIEFRTMPGNNTTAIVKHIDHNHKKHCFRTSTEKSNGEIIVKIFAFLQKEKLLPK